MTSIETHLYFLRNMDTIAPWGKFCAIPNDNASAPWSWDLDDK